MEKCGFKKGDMVLCVDDKEHGNGMSCSKLLTKGAIYVVDRVTTSLLEVSLRGVKLSWRTQRFIKLDDILSE